MGIVEHVILIKVLALMIIFFLIGTLSMSIESGYIQQLQGRQNYPKLNFIMVNLRGFNNTLLKKCVKDKIEGYKQQDTKANRNFNLDNYIHIIWLVKCFQKSCTSCGTSFEAFLGSIGNSRCNLTANRIDNDLSHELDNIEPMCVSCNSKLSNK